MDSNIIGVEIVKFLAFSWWFWAMFILLPLANSTWIFWRQELFKKGYKWVLLEIRMPREVTKNPQGMEQVLSAINSLRNVARNPAEIYWDGEVTRWFSLELVSFGGEVRFFIRVYLKQKGLVEAAFLSYYPDVELVEVDDYVDRFPETTSEMYEQGYEMWGTEMELSKESLYPIKTYVDFESPDEEKQYDPIASFLEVLAKVKPQEIVGIQINIAPAGHDWAKKFEGKLKELRVSKKEEGGSGSSHSTKTEFPGGILPAMSVSSAKENGKMPSIYFRSPGETDVLKAIERNIAKPAFDTLIRFVYLSPKTIYYDSFARRGLVGAFSQYAALDLNSFKQNFPMGTRTRIWDFPYLLPKRRVEYRKQRLLYNYRRREIPHETFIGKLITSYFFNWNFSSRFFYMNTECVATLFHPPTHGVLTAPHIKRVESKKMGPPAGLAIYGGDAEIEKFE